MNHVTKMFEALGKGIREIATAYRDLFHAFDGQVYWPPRAAARDIKLRLTTRRTP